MSEVIIADPPEQCNYLDTHPLDPTAQNAIAFIGVGANTRHLAEAGALPHLMAERPVYFFQHGEPQLDIPKGQLIRTDTASGRAEAEELRRSGALHAEYVSTPPETHLRIIQDELALAGEGLLNRLVVAKPVVANEQQIEEADIALWEAEWSRMRRGIPMPRVGDQEKSFLYVHEHYQRKEAWSEFQRRLGDVIGILGRPTSVLVDIEEPKTLEEEHRERAFGDGALPDIGTHATSLYLDVANAIDSSRRYMASNLITSQVRRFRYEPTVLQDDVETGFIVHGTSQVYDRVEHEEHVVDFTLMGGKGLSNRKEATVSFVHPDTGDESAITVDLKRNVICLPDDAPAELKALFPKTEFSDNGYGRVVLAGLNGGDPDVSFQHWFQAKVVTKWVAELTRQARKNDMVRHDIGTSLSEMDGVAVRTAGSRKYLVASGIGNSALQNA